MKILKMASLLGSGSSENNRAILKQDLMQFETFLPRLVHTQTTMTSIYPLPVICKIIVVIDEVS